MKQEDATEEVKASPQKHYSSIQETIFERWDLSGTRTTVSGRIYIKIYEIRQEPESNLRRFKRIVYGKY